MARRTGRSRSVYSDELQAPPLSEARALGAQQSRARAGTPWSTASGRAGCRPRNGPCPAACSAASSATSPTTSTSTSRSSRSAPPSTCSMWCRASSPPRAPGSGAHASGRQRCAPAHPAAQRARPGCAARVRRRRHHRLRGAPERCPAAHRGPARELLPAQHRPHPPARCRHRGGGTLARARLARPRTAARPLPPHAPGSGNYRHRIEHRALAAERVLHADGAAGAHPLRQLHQRT